MSIGHARDTVAYDAPANVKHITMIDRIVPAHPGFGLDKDARLLIQRACQGLRPLMRGRTEDAVWVSDNLRKRAGLAVDALNRVLELHWAAVPGRSPARSSVFIDPDTLALARTTLNGLYMTLAQIPSSESFWNQRRVYLWGADALRVLKTVQQLHTASHRAQRMDACI